MGMVIDVECIEHYSYAICLSNFIRDELPCQDQDFRMTFRTGFLSVRIAGRSLSTLSLYALLSNTFDEWHGPV